MYLSYEEEYDRIMYDHLAPETPALVGMYSMYVPDLSYDALVNENGRWVLKEDVIGVNKDEPETITILVKDEKTGEFKEKKIKNKWEEPSKSHVATTPEDQMREEQKDKLKQPSTTPTFPQQSGKKKPKSYNPVDQLKKKRK